MDGIVTTMMNQQDVAWVQCDGRILDIGWSEFFDMVGNTVDVFKDDFLAMFTQQPFNRVASLNHQRLS